MFDFVCRAASWTSSSARTKRSSIDFNRDACSESCEAAVAVSSELAELIQSISMAAGQQARASENISNTMEEVGEISAQTSAASRQTAVSMGNLAETSDQLLSSVAAFKLDEKKEAHGEN